MTSGPGDEVSGAARASGLGTASCALHCAPLSCTSVSPLRSPAHTAHERTFHTTTVLLFTLNLLARVYPSHSYIRVQLHHHRPHTSCHAVYICCLVSSGLCTTHARTTPPPFSFSLLKSCILRPHTDSPMCLCDVTRLAGATRYPATSPQHDILSVLAENQFSRFNLRQSISRRGVSAWFSTSLYGCSSDV